MKVKILNRTLKEYNSLLDKKEYDFALMFAKTEPKDIFNFGDFNELTFNEVKVLQKLFNENKLDYETIVNHLLETKRIEDGEVENIKIFDLRAGLYYVRIEIEKINELENKLLSSTPDPDAHLAGIEKFNKFGYFIQIDELAAGNILEYENVKNLKYGVCLMKLTLNKDRYDYQKDINEIKSRKHEKH